MGANGSGLMMGYDWDEKLHSIIRVGYEDQGHLSFHFIGLDRIPLGR